MRCRGHRWRLLGGLLGLVCGWTGTASAFHAAQTFADAPEQGGGGGVFYSGTVHERGWDCAACHTQPGADIKVRFTTDLFSSFEYEPEEAYAFTISLDEQLGISSTRSNYNGFVLSMLTSEGRPAGRLTNAPADRYYVRSNSAGDVSILATAGQDPGETEWSFTWIAPPRGTGPVTLALGVVDGNGADSSPDETLTDPFGDGVFMAKVDLTERGGAATAATPSYGPVETTGLGLPARLALGLGLAVLGWRSSRKRRARMVAAR